MNKTTIKISVLAFLGFMTYGYAQQQQQDPYKGKVGVNTIEPSATMDIRPSTANAQKEATTNEGIIAPKLSKTRIANIATPVEGTLVYATDATYTAGSDATVNNRVAKITEKGYYFYNGTEWVKAGNNSLAVDGSKWTNDTANNTVKLTNLSDGTTPRTDDKNIFIHDSGKVGIGTSTPDRLFSILGDQPATDQLGQFIIKTEENSNSDAGITLLSKKAHASLKLGSGVDSDSQILFDMSSNFENNNYSKTFNIWYDYSSVDENLRYLGFRSNLHPTESSGIFFNVLGRLGLGVKEPKEKIDVYNPTGFTIMKASNDLGFSKFGTRDTGDTYVGFKNKFQLWNADETIPMLEVTQDGNVGIGMGNPSEKLEVNGSIKANSLAGSGNRPVYADAEGKLVIGNSTTIRSAWVPDTASNSVQLAITSANGDRTTHPISITDEGMVRATSFQGVNGATIFPDYVFQKYYTGTSSIKADYSFKSLSQVEDFVKTNGHLPGYKSAETIKAQGYVDLMETQLTNVEKIEELYLHSIEQDKALKAKESKIQELEAKNAALESRLERLEKLIQ